MSSSDANQFKEDVLARIMGAYRRIDTERIYLLLSDISLGSPSPGLAHDEARFVLETLQLLKTEFRGIDAAAVQVALGQLAQETGRARRGAAQAPPLEQPPSPPQSAPGRMPARRSQASAAYVRALNWSYVRAWDPKKSRLGLQFESTQDLETYCKELAQDGGFREELDPAPREFAALTIEVSASGFEPVLFRGSAVGRDGQYTLIDVPSLPPRLRKAAAQLRAKISRAHSSIRTPVVDSAALSRSIAEQARSVVSAPLVSEVSGPRPAAETPGNPRESAEHLAANRRRRADARTNQVPVVGEATPLESDFARIPTGGGGGLSTEPGSDERTTNARRRRARAVSRTHTHTGSTARVVDDELKRFGQRTGRRTRTHSHETVPAAEDSPTRPPVTEFDVLPSSDTVDTATTLRAGATQVTATPPALEVDAASVPTMQLENRPSPRVPTTTAGPSTPRASAVSGPLQAVELDADSSIEVGPLIARKDGAHMLGGASAVLLDAAAAYPSSIVTINSRHRTWKIAVREDVILHLAVVPNDPAFSIETAVRRSGLVDSADLQTAVRDAAASGQKLTEILVKSRKILFRQLDAVLIVRAQLMFQVLFAEEVTSFSVVGYESIQNRGYSPILTAPAAWQYLKQACNNLPQDEIDRFLNPHYADRPHFVTDAFLNAATLQFTAKETKFVTGVLVGDCTVSQGIAKSPLRRRRSVALILALDRVGLIKWEKVETAATRVARVWSVIETKLREIDGATNPFELLEAHWSSDRKLVGDSFLALCRLLDLDYVQQNGTAEEQEAAARLREGFVRTREMLKEREDRHRYRCQIVDEFNRRNAAYLYEKQAELALYKSDYSSAEDSLRRVVEMAPSHPTAAAQLKGVIATLQRRDH